MMLSDHELWSYIREDLPYFDLTTHLIDPAQQKAILCIITRNKVMAVCTEEAARIAQMLGCEVRSKSASGTLIEKGSVLLEIEGDAKSLHEAWRLCQILLEYACGMATYAHEMATKARAVNPDCDILVTRKSFPFAKRFSIRALLAGGILPHRLGLSESVLIFHNHRKLYPNASTFEAALPQIKKKCAEKKLVVESETLEDAKRMLELGADVIQMDKCTIETLGTLVSYKCEHHPHATIIVAGGINKENVASYAQTGVNAIVTSSPYQADMADLTSTWKSLS